MVVEIVKLSIDTVHYLDNVAAGVFDNPIDSKQLTAFMEDPRHLMFIAFDGGTVVGMASSVEYFHPDKPPQMFINEVGVAPTYHRRGIGRALTERLVSEAKNRGCVYAWLGTAQDNVAGQRCFGSVLGVEPGQAFQLFEWDLDD